MGTNYYAIKKATPSDKKRIKQLIDLDQWQQVRRELPEEIHIGKSSMGWSFCFDHNHWEYWGKTKKSLESFLGECFIYDEYGSFWELKDFWELVNDKKDGRNGEHVEYHDGLKYSKSTDFF